MKRAVILASLVIFACSSVFLLCSCAKKQVVAEEKEITAPPNTLPELEMAKKAHEDEKE